MRLNAVSLLWCDNVKHVKMVSDEVRANESTLKQHIAAGSQGVTNCSCSAS